MRNRIGNKAILILILLVAVVLRVYHFKEVPFTHDEFSALFRTHFDSFSELIEKGVIPDTLPAGVQVFLYFWTKWFGYAEWIVKLPFLVFGILSVFLVYLLGKKWYNETVGLIAAAYLSSLEYTVMYSQIARPYISGLFFSLAMVYFWTQIIQNPERKFYLNSFFFIITAGICAYNHHFSLLFAAIVGFSGLFLIRRKYLVKYLIACVIIMLLYIPHISIILRQIRMGGNEGWLGKIRYDFIINYLAYIFHFTFLSYVLALLLVIYGFIGLKKNDFNRRYFVLSLTWFFTLFLIGFLYSKFVNNVLQYSVLIFAFPFLLFILFGHIRILRPRVNAVAVILILLTNIYGLVRAREYYRLFYNSHYIHILSDRDQAAGSHGNMASLIDSDRRISEYYIQKLDMDTGFTWFDTFTSEKDLIGYLKQQRKANDFLYLGCLSSNDPLTVPVIRDYFPTLETQRDYAGGTTFIFSKAERNDDDIVEFQGFESRQKPYWTGLNVRLFIDSAGFSGSSAYQFNRNTEWGPAYVRDLDDIMKNKNDFIDISVKVRPEGKAPGALVVATLESRGKQIYWGGTPFSRFIPGDSIDQDWYLMHHSVKLSDINLDYSGLRLKVYIWNKGKDNFIVDDFIIRLRRGNPVIYGLVEKI